MTDPTTGPPADPAPEPDDLEDEGATLRRRLMIAALIVATLVMAAIAFILVRDGDDEDDVSTTDPSAASSTSTTAAPTTTTGPETSTSAPAPTTTGAPPPDVDRSTAIWPTASSAVRFTEPVAAARGFAVTYLGFTDPTVGSFQQGDSRSGEVAVQPEASGPTTTILVRELADGAWYVLGAATPDIQITEPQASAVITSPVALSGTALAFEGQVAVEVREDGSLAPIGTGSVTGGGDVARPYSGSVSFEPPTADAGALVMLIHSERDGSVWAATAIRVRFR